MTITRRNAITAALASAAIPVVAGVPAMAVAAMGPAAAGADNLIDWAGARARAEQMVDWLRTCYVCGGWHEAFDEAGAARMLNYFRNPEPPDVPADRFAEEVVRWTADHNQSLDWLLDGNPGGMICRAASRSKIAAGLLDTDDPILAAIEAHRQAHKTYVAVIEGTDDDDPARNVVSDAADNVAIELLNVTPTTVAGVVALLQYGYEFEAAGHWWPGNIETGEEPEPHIDSTHKWHALLFQHAAKALGQITGLMS